MAGRYMKKSQSFHQTGQLTVTMLFGRMPNRNLKATLKELSGRETVLYLARDEKISSVKRRYEEATGIMVFQQRVIFAVSIMHCQSNALIRWLVGQKAQK